MPRKNAGNRDQSIGDNLYSVVQQVLIKDVAPTVEDILKKHIQSDIYDSYTPRTGAWINGETYNRRHILENSITSEIIDGSTLLVTSTASANDTVVAGWEFSNKYPGAFLEMLASGDMGIWKDGFSRPAVENAQAEVDNSSAVRTALERGIQKALNRGTETNK